MDTAQLTWNEGLTFTAAVASGQTLQASSDKDNQGVKKGFGPMELMALSVGACTAMDVISILEKKHQEVTAFEIKVNSERAENHPRIFTSMEVEYILTGKAIDPAAVERAIELSAEKYCSAQNIVKRSVDIQHTYKIIEG
jgi:putative redox protein